MQIATRFLLTFVSLGPQLVQLLVVVAIAFEAADMVEPALVIHPCCQRLDAQVKGHHAVITQRTWLAFFASLACCAVLIVFVLLRIVIDERAIIAPTPIPGDGHFMKIRKTPTLSSDTQTAIMSVNARLALLVAQGSFSRNQGSQTGGGATRLRSA